MITVHDCKIRPLRPLPGSNSSDRCLSETNSTSDLPFEIARVYYLYDVVDGEKRGGHAHRKLQQLIVPVAGSFDLVIDDGIEKREISLDRPDQGLHIPGHIWTDVMNFSPGAICMVLASLPYDEAEYIRDYQQFLQFKNVAEPLNEASPQSV